MQYYVIDAFADELFRGNPAGVCLPDRALSADLMQRIAQENNLSETAFALPTGQGYQLRWFTPETEIDLCGHATLATAFVLLGQTQQDSICFDTQSGILTVTRQDDRLVMDFPARMPKPVDAPLTLAQALGCQVLETHLSRDLLALLPTEQDVANLQPDFAALRAVNQSIGFAVIVTAAGDSCDFVSRFFAPNAGVAEDPVTGSAHSTLIPFWSERLRKKRMTAQQLSSRGGTLFCESDGDRVKIGGKAVCYLKGEIQL